MAFILLSRPTEQNLQPLLHVGATIPESPLLASINGLHLVAFLRHVGCPFAELMIKKLKVWATNNPQVTITIVSHGSEATTHSWLASIGGAESLHIVIDPQRYLHSQWGVGLSNLKHFIHPRPLLSVVKLLFKGIRNRKASGTRWQPSAVFLIKNKTVLWRHIADSADEIELPPE